MPPDARPATAPTGLDRTPWAIAAIATLAAAIHLATAGRYDMFRNELYFIVCGRHPAFGYADQPPLVPLLAAATQGFGDHVWLLRLPAVAAAVGLIPLTAALARLFGASRTAAIVAALAAATAPALAGLTAVLTTETFEPLCWTACAYLVARALLRGERPMLLWAGLVAGIAMELKYGIAIWLIALGLGIAATAARRMLAWPSLWAGLALAAGLSAPSMIWQALHGWPFLQVIAHHSASIRPFTGGPVRFEIGQILAMNLVLAPLWLAGVIGPFAGQRLRGARFLAIAFVAATAIVLISGGKDYYLFPAYPAVFAIGAVALQNLNRWVLRFWLTAALLNAALVAPIVLPILSPDGLARYFAKAHFKPRPDEREAVGAPLTQLFSDQFGWRNLEAQVAKAYRALPPEEQSRVAIMASNYGEAAAIDVYGRKDDLPAALSGQNQYFIWGPRGHDGSLVLAVNGDPARWRRMCRNVEIVGGFGAAFAMPYEYNRPILLCRGLSGGLVKRWYGFQRYD